MGYFRDAVFAELERRGERYSLGPPGSYDFEPWDDTTRHTHDKFALLAESKKKAVPLIEQMRDLRAAGKLEGQEDKLRWALQTYFRAKELIEARLSGWLPTLRQ